MKKLLSVLFAMVMVFTVPITSMAYSDRRVRIPYFFDNISYFFDAGKDFDSIILLNSASLVSDGLSASGLVGASNGILFALDNSHDVETDNMDYVYDLLQGDKSKTIYLIGGNKVIPRGIKSQLINRGYKCITLAGRTRVETSYRVAEEIERLTGSVDEIAITNAYKGIPDAASIAYEAVQRKMPVILTNGKTIPFSTNGIKTYAIGGNKVMSDSLIKRTSAIRLAGSNRYLTNKKVIQYFGRDKGHKFAVADGNWNYFSILLSCVKDIDPVVLVSDYSDKTVFEGAQHLTFYNDVEPASGYIRSACKNAAYGKTILNGMYKIYKTLGVSKDNYAFKYNTDINIYPSDAISLAKKLSKKYYIYDELFADMYGNWGPPRYSSYLIRKSDGKIFYWQWDSNYIEPLRVR